MSKYCRSILLLNMLLSHQNNCFSNIYSALPLYVKSTARGRITWEYAIVIGNSFSWQCISFYVAGWLCWCSKHRSCFRRGATLLFWISSVVSWYWSRDSFSEFDSSNRQNWYTNSKSWDRNRRVPGSARNVFHWRRSPLVSGQWREIHWSRMSRKCLSNFEKLENKARILKVEVPWDCLSSSHAKPGESENFRIGNWSNRYRLSVWRHLVVQQWESYDEVFVVVNISELLHRGLRSIRLWRLSDVLYLLSLAKNLILNSTALFPSSKFFMIMGKV